MSIDISINNLDFQEYKNTLIRNWLQKCENQENFKIICNDYINSDETSFLLKDKFFIDKYKELGKVFYTSTKKKYSFHKRKGSDSESSNIILYDIETSFINNELFDNVIKTWTKKSFWSKSKNYTNTEKVIKDNLIKFDITEKNISGNKVLVNTPILVYNNIIIPISISEFNELIEYEKECQRRNDLQELYRTSTYLTHDEYKKFIEYRKEEEKIMSKNIK